MGTEDDNVLKMPLLLLFSCSAVSNSATPWTAARQASLSSPISRSLLKLMCIESVMPSNHLILSPPLLLSSVFPSISVFSNQWTLHSRWPNYWSFSFAFRWWKSFKIDCGCGRTSLWLCHNQYFAMGELYINKIILTKVMVHIKWSIATLTVQKDMKKLGELGMLV